jgi:hypothetical protein
MESQLSEGVLHTSDGDSLVEAYEQLSKQLQEEMSRWEELCTSLEAIKQQ